MEIGGKYLIKTHEGRFYQSFVGILTEFGYEVPDTEKDNHHSKDYIILGWDVNSRGLIYTIPQSMLELYDKEFPLVEMEHIIHKYGFKLELEKIRKIIYED